MNSIRLELPDRWLSMGHMFLLLLMFSACEQVKPPPRPAGVPAQAVWAGGPDGGSFISCEVIQRTDRDHCTVWNDSTGQIAEEGDYRLLRENHAARTDELQFRWADRGGQIGLKDNKVLKKIDAKQTQ